MYLQTELKCHPDGLGYTRVVSNIDPSLQCFSRSFFTSGSGGPSEVPLKYSIFNGFLSRPLSTFPEQPKKRTVSYELRTNKETRQGQTETVVGESPYQEKC